MFIVEKSYDGCPPFLARLEWNGNPFVYRMGVTPPSGWSWSYFGGHGYNELVDNNYSRTFPVQFPQMQGMWQFKVIKQGGYLDTVNGDPWTLRHCDIADVCTTIVSGVGGSNVYYTVDFASTSGPSSSPMASPSLVPTTSVAPSSQPSVSSSPSLAPTASSAPTASVAPSSTPTDFRYYYFK